jgi:hypothetical protein
MLQLLEKFITTIKLFIRQTSGIWNPDFACPLFTCAKQAGRRVLGLGF